MLVFIIVDRYQKWYNRKEGEEVAALYFLPCTNLLVYVISTVRLYR